MIQVTDNMTYNDINSELLNETTQIYNLQNEISSGLQINSPQDNPAGMVNVLTYDNSTALVTQYNSTVGQAAEVSSLASSTITNAMGIVNQASSLAIEMANGTNSSTDQQAASQQVGQMISQLLQYADTSYGGQNIFTGQTTQISSAYSSATANYKPGGSSSATVAAFSVYTYAGTDANQNYQISQSETVAPSLTADAIFGNDPKPSASSTATTPSGLLSVLSLFQGELKNGTYQANSSGIISGINNSLSLMSSAQATIGTVVQRLNDQQTSYQTVLTNISQLKSQTQDVNVAAAMTNLTQMQNSYQATLEAASGISSLTPMLLNYLK